MKPRIELLLILMGLGSFLGLRAQTYPADVKSVDAILASLYEVISGPAGQERDIARFRNLFAPGAQLIAQVEDSTGKRLLVYRSVEQFAEGIKRYTAKNGFFEQEIGRRTETWDGMAHVWSTYESRHALSDPQPFARGINSIQLYNDGTRWWVVNIYWQPEMKGAVLPKKYLKGKRAAIGVQG